MSGRSKFIFRRHFSPSLQLRQIKRISMHMPTPPPPSPPPGSLRQMSAHQPTLSNDVCALFGCSQLCLIQTNFRLGQRMRVNWLSWHGRRGLTWITGGFKSSGMSLFASWWVGKFVVWLVPEANGRSEWNWSCLQGVPNLQRRLTRALERVWEARALERRGRFCPFLLSRLL